MNEEDITREAIEIDNQLEEEPKKGWGPIKYIILVFLLFIMVLWAIPYYGVKLNPEPKYIPTLQEVLPQNMLVGNETITFENRYDYRKFVYPKDPSIKQLATRIATLACEGNQICHAKAVYYFVRNNFEYVSDPVNTEYVEDPKEFTLSGGGDCESGTLLLASLEEAIGIDAQLVFITGHAYLRIKLPRAPKRYKIDGWIYLDWTCKSCDFGEIPWQNVQKEASYLEVP